jgi:hypothetical protein
MALYLSQTKENPIVYPLWPGYSNPDPSYVWDKYNPFLHTAPRIYDETLTSVTGFTYIPPPRDIFVLWTMLNISRWPSWEARSYYFNAQTGDYISQQAFVAQSYITSIEIGDLGHAYCTFASTTDCAQKNWETLADESASWKIRPYRGNFNPGRIFAAILVDRQNDKLLGYQVPNLDIWTNVTTGTPSLSWCLRQPLGLKDLAYESNDYAWLLCSAGEIIKLDWNKNKRIELVSSIQNANPTDRGYSLAFDQKRKRLAMFRWMPDATDGAARNRIEFYETIPKPRYITEPVPITRHRTNDAVRFRSNLIGDVGEGFSGATGEVSLVAPNNHGSVVSPAVLSGALGEIEMVYKAPDDIATDTIKIETTFTEDITLEGGTGLV